MSAVWGAVRRGLVWLGPIPSRGAQVITTGMRDGYVPPSASVDPPPEAPASIAAEQCPSCMRDVLDTWAYCPDCSTALRGSRPAKVRPREYTSGGYRGGLPADQVGPPARLPSASMRPREYAAGEPCPWVHQGRCEWPGCMPGEPGTGPCTWARGQQTVASAVVPPRPDTPPPPPAR